MIPFLKEVAQDLFAKFGDNIADCAIVFNNKRPASYLQKYLVEIYGKPVWSPSFFTVSEFFATATNLQMADQYMQFFTLYDCYVELQVQEGEKMTSISKFHQIARIILGDFAQIDNDLVDADRLFEELEDIAEINKQFDFLSDDQKAFLSQFWKSYTDGKYKKQQEAFIKMWRRMPKLFRAFHQRLKDEGFTTLSRLYRNIANNQTAIDFTAKYEGQKLIFIGFNALSKAEAKAFVRWHEDGKAIFYFDTDSYYLDDETQEAGLFLRRNIKQLGLVNQLPNNVSYINAQPRDVNVYKVQGQTGQAKILNELLAPAYDTIAKGENMETVAIVLADESLLIPVMQTVPTRIGNQKVDLNITMGFNLSNASLHGLMDLWLEVQAETTEKRKPDNLSAIELKKKPTVTYKTVEAFLSHPLIGLSQAKRYQIQDALIAEQLLEVPISRLQNQGGLVGEFFRPMTKTSEIIAGLKTMVERVFTRELATKTLKKIEASLFNQVLQSLNRLDDLLKAHIEKYNEKVDFHFVLSLAKKSLADILVPLEGSALKGFQVMGLLETRNLNFDRVIFLGLNEGIVPQASTGNTFIPDSLRRAYGLPVLENQDAISAYMFYRLLQRTKKIDFIYNGLTDESSSGEVSRFVKQLEYESKFNFSHKELQLAVKTENRDKIEIEKTPKVQEELNKFLDGSRKLSASALTTYILNPVDFFYKYVAGIKEPDKVEETVEAYKLGLILHYVMEYFYLSLSEDGQEITAERINAKRSIIPDLILEGFADCLYNPENNRETKAQRRNNVLKIKANLKLNGMQKVVFEIVKEYVNIILTYDADNAPFTLVGLEQKQVVDFDIQVNGETKKLKLLGIIDRVDFRDGVHRIVDYKSGGDDLKYSTIDECFDSDCGKINKALVQTLFYTYVYEQFSKISHIEPQLYVVKSMREKGVNFVAAKQQLKDTFLASEKELFLKKMKEKLEELFDYSIPFKASAEPSNYTYSIYKTLFGG